MRFLILIIAALLLAGGVVFLMGGDKKTAKKIEDGHYVLVSNKDLLPGSFVQVNQSFAWSEIDESQFTDEQKVHFLRKENTDVNLFEGAVVRHFVARDAVVVRESLVTPGEGGFMSAVLYPGMRAVSIAVNVVSGNAGFIFPGDKVDLLLTHRIESPDGRRNYATETFVEDVRVLAIDQNVNNPEKQVTIAKTVTLEVTPKQAEEVLVAEELGKISLILRSLGNVTFNGVDRVETDKFTQGDDVSKVIKTYNPNTAGSVTVTRGGQ